MSRGNDSPIPDEQRHADVHVTREGRSYIDLDNPDSVRAVLCKADQYSKIKIVSGKSRNPEAA